MMIPALTADSGSPVGTDLSGRTEDLHLVYSELSALSENYVIEGVISNRKTPAQL